MQLKADIKCFTKLSDIHKKIKQCPNTKAIQQNNNGNITQQYHNRFREMNSGHQNNQDNVI